MIIRTALCLIIITGTLIHIPSIASSKNNPFKNTLDIKIKEKIPLLASIPLYLSQNNENDNIKNIDTIKTSIKEVQSASTSIGSVLYNISKHENIVRSVSFSPDGRVIASGSMDETIRLWNVTTGNEVHLSSPQGKVGYVYSVAFSPDGSILASSHGDGTVKLWSTTNGELVHTMSHSPNVRVTSVNFSPNGAILASGSADETLKLWDITSGTEIEQPMIRHANGVNSVIFSPDGTVLASCGADNVIRLWSVPNGIELQQSPLEGHDNEVYSIDFSPDGTLLVSGSADETIRIWYTINGSQSHLSPLEGYSGLGLSVAFSPDGRTLASGSVKNGIIRLWNVTTGKTVQNLTGHTERVFSIKFSPDGNILASASRDNFVKAWNLIKPIEVKKSNSHDYTIKSMAFSPINSLLASGSEDATVKIWNWTNSVEILSISPNQPVSCVTWSPDEKVIVSGSSDGTIGLWNVTNGNPLPQSPLEGHDIAVSSCTFSPDGLIMASGGADKEIKLWNATNWNQSDQSPLVGHNGGITSLSFSPNGLILASGSIDSTIRLWNVTDWKELDHSPLVGHNGGITSLSFSPDGLKLISGSYDRTIRLWNVTTGKKIPISPLYGHQDVVRSIDISPDGSMIASGSSDNSVKLFNMMSGEELLSISGKISIFSVAFSPDGMFLALNNDNMIELYNVNPLPKDIDGDGIPDYWEYEQQLNSSNYQDRFNDPDRDGLMNIMEFFLKTHPFSNDTDGDSMLDGKEFLIGLNPVLNDATLDSDGDGMLNLYEYQTSLNPNFDDTTGDKDGDGLTNIQEHEFNSWANQIDSDMDGMSDYHEFIYDFNPTDDSDAKIDSDGDWILNIDEIKAGSNPRDFLNVPIISFSALHFGITLIILFFSAFGGLTIKKRKDKRQGILIMRLNAPDYPTALKIQASGTPDYATYKQIKDEANVLLEKGWSYRRKGSFTVTIQSLDKALELFERIDNKLLIVETVFLIALIKKEKQDLTTESSILNHIPQPPHDDKRIETLNSMIKALLTELDKNWGTAAVKWQNILGIDDLEEKYRIICQVSLERIKSMKESTLTPVNLENLRVALCLGSLTDSGLNVQGKSKNCLFDEQHLCSMMEYIAVLHQQGDVESIYGPFPQTTTEESPIVEWHFISYGFRIKDESIKDSRVIRRGGMVPALILLFYPKEFDSSVISRKITIEKHLNSLIDTLSSIQDLKNDKLNDIEGKILRIFK
ncbi:MAG: WD40 domain-containing protein [Candidatus Hodarchaeales archaeon]|jgi:WD40 repeat protein